MKLAKSNSPPSNDTFLNSITEHIRKCAQRLGARGLGHLFVETAGGTHNPTALHYKVLNRYLGVHSPTLNGLPQADAYRPLFLPTILVGDPNLGGISTTIAAYEALLLRGFIVDLVLMLKDKDNVYRNWEYLSEYFSERGIRVDAFHPPPAPFQNPEENFRATKAYYDSFTLNPSTITLNSPKSGQSSTSIHDSLIHLTTLHTSRISQLNSMPRRTLDSVWWPFVQHAMVNEGKEVNVIDSAHGDFFSVFRASTSSVPSLGNSSVESLSQTSLLHSQFDSSASWWTQTFGHGNARLTLAAAQAAGRYGHVMWVRWISWAPFVDDLLTESLYRFPRSSHAPALHLAECLLSPQGPGFSWASRVFFSDNGSTGMEVALKMALRTWVRRREDMEAVSHLSTSTSSNSSPYIESPSNTNENKMQLHGQPQDIGMMSRARQRRLGILGLKGSYHGDTIGAMDACEESGVYTSEWHDCKGYWFDPPRVFVKEGKAYVKVPSEQRVGEGADKTANIIPFPSLTHIYDVHTRLESQLYKQYVEYIRATLQDLGLLGLQGSSTNTTTELAALVLEPLVLGAGGMIFVDPLFQRALVDVVRPPESCSSPPLPIIYDEVFTGLHRLGPLTPGLSILGVSPDIAVYAKILTGGLVPMAVTLTTEEVFETFYYGPRGD